jgi:hypothetical protein
MTSLIALAHDHGGTDNITIILADVIDPNSKPVAIPSSETEPGPQGDRLAQADTATSLEPDSSASMTSENLAADVSADLSNAAHAENSRSDTSSDISESDPPAPSTSSGEADPARAATGETTQADRDNDTGTIHLHEDYPTSGLLGAAADPSLKELLSIMRRHGARAAATARPSVVAATRAESDASTPEKAERKSASAIAAQQERDRYRPGAKRAHLAVWLIILAVVVVLGGGGWGVYTYVTHQYYVADHEGEVAIFSGIPGDVAGIATTRVYQSTDIKLTELPLVWRDKVTDIIPIDFNDLEQANSTVDQLRSLSEQCLDRRDKRPASDPIPADGC